MEHDDYYWGDDDDMSTAALERAGKLMTMLMEGYDLVTISEDVLQGMECGDA